ncbi:unnamed protein product [Camellia sinensis]
MKLSSMNRQGCSLLPDLWYMRGMPDDPSKAVTGEIGSPVNPDEEDLCGIAEDHTNSLAVGIINSSCNLDEQIGNGWNIVRRASKDYILNFWIYFVIGFCYEFASLEGFLELHV